MPAIYDYRLVTLSVVIAVIVSYTALNLAGHVAESSGRTRHFWIFGGGITMGIGIWSMHFVGMLAMRMPMAVSYDPAITALSLLPAFAASALALFIAGGREFNSSRLVIGSVLMGGGIASMHYVGMAAMRMPAAVEYDPLMFAASLAIAIGASGGALYLAFNLREQANQLSWKPGAAATAMGVAIAGMHYTGMAAVSFVPLPSGVLTQAQPGLETGALATAITLLTLAVLTIVLLGAGFDRRFASQILMQATVLRRSKEELEVRVAERTRDLRELNEQLLRDIAARERAEQALAQEKERALVTLDSIADAVITTDVHGRIESLNPVAVELTGWPRERALGQPLQEVFRVYDEQTLAPTEDPVAYCVRTGTATGRGEGKLLVARQDQQVPIEDTAAPIRNGDGEIVGVVIVFHDVSEARQLARQLSHQASHDSLTGLVNRREFERRLRHALEQAHEDRVVHALLYLDLDQFKVVNDTCGHVAGDELLRQLALLLGETVRESDTLARLGGDEFGVLLSNCPLAKGSQIAESICRALKDFRFAWEGKSFEVGGSIGLVPITAESGSANDVMSAADVACYAAKDAGRNRVHLYQHDDEELVQRHGEMQWTARITRAFEEDRFTLYSQPIVPVIRFRAVVQHHEILIRMIGEEGEVIPPGAFLPAAERYGLMPTIDRWVIRRLFRYISERCGDERHENIFAVNLSGASLSDDHFLEFLREQFRVSDVPPASICFEITETVAIANLTKLALFMRELKALGCRFALDDFGSGLSSFAYLRNLPADYLKIDGRFIGDLARDPLDQAIVESVNRVGHAFGMETVAEFVEDDRTMRLLAEIGVDYAQGYGVERPMPLE